MYRIYHKAYFKPDCLIKHSGYNEKYVSAPKCCTHYNNMWILLGHDRTLKWATRWISVAPNCNSQGIHTYSIGVHKSQSWGHLYDCILHGVIWCLWALSRELALCHSAFLENLCSPVLAYYMLTLTVATIQSNNVDVCIGYWILKIRREDNAVLELKLNWHKFCDYENSGHMCWWYKIQSETYQSYEYISFYFFFFFKYLWESLVCS